SPAPVMTNDMIARTIEDIIKPTVAAMKDRGCAYTGVLYAGLMITEGGPKLIEYNVRFGDPECQVLMARLDSDILPALMATADGTLPEITLNWKKDAAMIVVMAANGYPGTYEKNTEIRGLDAANAMEDVIVLHAGTKKENDRYYATGGRVLGVTTFGETVTKAQKKAYDAIQKIDWPEGFCRKDIGWRAIEREK
ncbi:MAG: phosphoribosylamine--glycine ligase, partial [Sneathiella sp.]|nr:phosphoribosylamine--glycine ligase [Sneathiella sp.]